MTSSRCTNCVFAALPFKGGFPINKLVGKMVTCDLGLERDASSSLY